MICRLFRRFSRRIKAKPRVRVLLDAVWVLLMTLVIRPFLK
jgi:hypothetical protein